MKLGTPGGKRVLILVALVDLIAVVGLIAVWRSASVETWLGLSLLASLALFGGTGNVRVPGIKTAISSTDAFLFTALAAFGTFPAVVVAAAGVVGSALGKERNRDPFRIAFNFGNVVCSALAGSAVYMVAGGVAGGPVLEQALPLFAAGSVYFVSNVTLVAIAVALDSKRAFFETLVESARWAAVSTYVGLPLAALLLWAIQQIGTSALALGIPPFWLLLSFYRTNKIRQEAQQQRISQVEEHNTELEERVAERTQELQKALNALEEGNIRLRKANERLTEANQAKSEFLANVSHELRTPLNAIIGFSDLLGDGSTGPLSARQQEFVGDIHESGNHLLGLINSILDLSKIEAGKMEVHLETFDVRRALRDAAAMLRPLANRKSIDLAYEADESLRGAELDPGMFRQVLVNLLSNAIKFTEDGGRVALRAAARGLDLVVEVEDTGVGISPTNLDRVFEEFYQVDGSYARKHEGTGLGLALVKRMVSKQDGEIDVRSVVGEGSVFELRFRDCLREFPVESAAAETGAQSVAGSGRAAGRGSGGASSDAASRHEPRDTPTILVVEDNPLNMKLARNALLNGGFVVVEATSGERALECVQDQPVDLILMDIQLPGMDGLEITRRMKADPATADIPIVALSAHAKESDGVKARAAGCVGYITKPIRLSQFPGQVAGYLRAVDGAPGSGSDSSAAAG